MSSYLTINGITLPIALGTPDETPREIGETSPAFDGELRMSRQTTKQDMKFVTVPLALATAWAWQCLLEGRGEVWCWDSTHYGSKGTPPDATTGLTVGGAFKFGAGSLNVAATSPVNTAVYSVGLGSAWTVAVWRKLAAGSWVHYLVTSAGKKWVDGVRNDAASTTWLTVTTAVTLEGDTVDVTYYDDLVVLPFVVPDEWPPVWGVSASAFSQLARLDAAGDGLAEARTVMGAVTSSKMVPKAGARYRVLAVELQER